VPMFTTGWRMPVASLLTLFCTIY